VTLALRSPRLRRILLAYTINELGTWFGYVALALGVYDHTHSALAVAGLFVSGRLLPALLVPVLVARLEASASRGVLSRLYLAQAALAALLALFVWHFSLAAIILLVTIDGTATLAASSLLRAAAARGESPTGDPAPAGDAPPDHDAGELLGREANAALNIAFSGTVTAGPALAGLVVAAAGGPVALLIDAGSFLLCGVLLLRLRSHVEELSDDTSVRARLVAAWEHLRAVPRLRALLITEAVAIVFFTSVEPVEVLYAKATLHAGDSGFGVLVGVWGAGMVTGGILFARWVRRPLGPMLTGGTLLVGIAYLGWAAAPNLAVACIAALVGGIGNGVQWASLYSAVQGLTPQALHGRLMSAVQSMNALCPAIGFVLGGALAQLSSPRGAMLVAGVLASFATIGFLRLSVTAPMGSSQAGSSDLA
jgi:Transmembrane secretion effector